MKGLRLYKKEKLCSETAIASLFARGRDTASALDYPLRAVWRLNPKRRSDAPVAFLISVPKKRLRHAVDRVIMRRRIREAYRLSRHLFPMPEGCRADVAFIYIANDVRSYTSVARAVESLMGKIKNNLSSTDNTPSTLG